MLTELGNIFKSIFAWQNERGALHDVIRGILEPRPIQIEHTNSSWTISSRILCSSAGGTSPISAGVWQPQDRATPGLARAATSVLLLMQSMSNQFVCHHLIKAMNGKHCSLATSTLHS